MNECLTLQSLIPVLEIEKFIDLPPYLKQLDGIHKI